MGHNSQGLLGMIAYDTYRSRMVESLIFVGADDLQSLKDEICNGSCVLVLDRDGDVTRVTRTVALRIENSCGHLWVQLGKVTRDKLSAQCRLPGGVAFGQTVDEAVQQ